MLHLLSVHFPPLTPCISPLSLQLVAKCKQLEERVVILSDRKTETEALRALAEAETQLEGLRHEVVHNMASMDARDKRVAELESKVAVRYGIYSSP